MNPEVLDVTEETTAVETDREMPVLEIQKAIAAKFFEVPERLDIRTLWSRGGVSYMRVNWWNESHMHRHQITRSAFVRVESVRDGWLVTDCTGRNAA